MAFIIRFPLPPTPRGSLVTFALLHLQAFTTSFEFIGLPQPRHRRRSSPDTHSTSLDKTAGRTISAAVMADPSTSPSSQRSPSLNTQRKPLNPFTRNQDTVAAIADGLRRQSVGPSCSETIADESDEDQDGLIGPGTHIEKGQIPEGNRVESVTGVSQPAMGSAPNAGLPLQPRLAPAGAAKGTYKSQAWRTPLLFTVTKHQDEKKTPTSLVAHRRIVLWPLAVGAYCALTVWLSKNVAHN